MSSTANLNGVTLEEEEVIKKAALYLESDDFKYVNGVNLVADGGHTIMNPTFGLVFGSLLSSTQGWKYRFRRIYRYLDFTNISEIYRWIFLHEYRYIIN